MPTNHFGTGIAERYDADCAAMFDAAAVTPAVDFLANLADGGAALEFAVGTGRIALPLAARGVEISGIDLSPEMIDMLRAKPGSEAINTTVGDIATTRVDGKFQLVFLVFNTILNLTTQAEQVACFHNAAAHLQPGGAFVIESLLPDLRRLPPGERFVPFAVTPEHIGFDEYDCAEQRQVSHHHWFDGDATRWFSIPFRYVWPSELDVMAQLAGMSLAHRWSDWTQAPFDHESTAHVSVWVKERR